MKKTKHSEEKIVGAVKQLEAGQSVKEVARLKVLSQAPGMPCSSSWRRFPS